MTRRPRIDPDALVRDWPLLFETDTPDGKDFTDRTDRLVVDLSSVDRDALEAKARAYRSSLAGLVLHILFEFFYGYYLLAKMRRQSYGLYKGYPVNDPAAGTPFRLDDDARMHLRVPHRLWLDLDRIAQREAVVPSDLAGLIVLRFLEGHAPDVLPEKE